MPEPRDAVDLADGIRLAVGDGEDGLTAYPLACGADGHWHRARAGDGAGEALVNMLAAQDGWVAHDRFTVRSWGPPRASGERAMGVDQTNESVIVGDTAVVKWAVHLQDGPHPAPRRIAVLRDAGFRGMPTPLGFVTWRTPNGEETLAASVDEYLPGAVDGWTWAVQLITDAVSDGHTAAALDAATDVGSLVADMHAALAETATFASQQDADRWRASAMQALHVVCASELSGGVAFARERRGEIGDILDRLGALAGTPIIEGHGDLHVGQVLLAEGRFVVTDFDGNPVLDARERALPIPAALDVAGMTQSLAHAAIVARRYTPLNARDLGAVDTAMRSAFLAAYADRLRAHDHTGLLDAAALRPFRVQQVLREIIYATRHLPRWMYVPDAALPSLLDEAAVA